MGLLVEVRREPLLEDKDWSLAELRPKNFGLSCVASFSFFSISLAVSGVPSHFELTLGTVGGSLADDTPGMPTDVMRPFFRVPCVLSCLS